jgi:3-oxoacyl-(acyl-carrier-protein) synthase
MGDAATTLDRLLAGKSALSFHPVLGCDGGDAVPLALCNPWQPKTGDAPRWAAPFFQMLGGIPERTWGAERYPIFITSSNFGIDNLYAHHRHPRPGQLPFILPQRLTEYFRRELGWGANITHFSHACVSSNLGLLYASRQVAAGLADEALIVSYDFLSPFVAAGFHAMKILIGEMPAPYAARDFGAIGLGDGAAFAVVAPLAHGGRSASGFRVEAQEGFNEMYHFTGNHPDGVGMAELGARMRSAAGGRRIWVKGHGTGTIEAGRLEARHMAACFPGSPLVSWKGALGHTLGSCGLVEMALAMESVRRGRAPGTIGSSGPCFSAEVATETFDVAAFDGVVLNSFAFGGAHYAFLLCYD